MAVSIPEIAGWQSRTLQRLGRLGLAGIGFGPGVRWMALAGDGAQAVAGPFTTTAQFDAWLDDEERARVAV